MAKADIQVKLTLTGLKQFQKGLKQVSANTKKFGVSLKDVGKSALIFGKNLAKGAALASAAIVAVTARFAEFESEFANVVTLLDESSFSTGTLAEGIAALEGGIISLRAETGETFANLNKGLFDLVSAGVAAGDAIETLGVATELALAGATDTAIAVDGITTALGAFGKEAGTARSIAQKFFTAQKFGKTTIEALSGSIGLVAATSAASGVSFDELLASVSAATLTGIRTKAAFTGLKAAITNIIKPTDRAQKEAERLGIQFDGAALRSKGLVGLLKQVTSSSNFNADSFSKLFGSIEALNFAQAISVRNFSATNQIMGALNNQTQLAATFNDALAVKQDTVSFATGQLIGKLDSLAVQVGKVLAPAIKEITRLLGDLVEKFGPRVILFFEDFSKKVQDFVAQFAGANIQKTIALIEGAFLTLRNAALDFFEILSGIVTAIADVIKVASPVIKELSANLDNLAKRLGFVDGKSLLVAAAIGQITGANALFKDSIIAVLLLMNIFGLNLKTLGRLIVLTVVPAFIALASTPLGVAIIALTALFVFFIARNADLKEILNDLAGVFKTLAVIIVNVLAGAILGLIKVFARATQLGANLAAVLDRIFKGTSSDEFTAALARNKRAFDEAGSSVTDFANRFTKGLFPILNKAKDQIKEITQLSEAQRKELNRPFPTLQNITTPRLPTGFTGGGMVHGPGTSTSDSIPAMLSTNEFVMKAKSVRKFGANFMHMINRGVLPAFADGGLVSALNDSLSGAGRFVPIPSAVVVGAGPNKAQRPINLTLPGIGTFPLFGEEDTARNLQRSLRKSNLNKSSPFPLWYR